MHVVLYICCEHVLFVNAATFTRPCCHDRPIVVGWSAIWSNMRCLSKWMWNLWMCIKRCSMYACSVVRMLWTRVVCKCSDVYTVMLSWPADCAWLVCHMMQHAGVYRNDGEACVVYIKRCSMHACSVVHMHKTHALANQNRHITVYHDTWYQHIGVNAKKCNTDVKPMYFTSLNQRTIATRRGSKYTAKAWFQDSRIRLVMIVVNDWCMSVDVCYDKELMPV